MKNGDYYENAATFAVKDVVRKSSSLDAADVSFNNWRAVRVLACRQEHSPDLAREIGTESCAHLLISPRGR
jgi:hypothetical protein